MPHSKLSDIRQKIDTIDAQIHRLLMDRADIVDDLVQIKTQEATENGLKPVTYHPAREALLLKNILQNHQGKMPFSAIIEIWRALISTFCGMQCDFSIAYFDKSFTNTPDYALRDLLRYYFGSLARLNQLDNENSVLQTFKQEQATLAVLPITNDDIIDQWWLNLPQNSYVSAILPFVQNDPIIRTRHNYMVISSNKPIETGDDKSLFKVMGSPDVGRVSIANCFADLQQEALSLCIFDAGDLSQRFHLIEVNGFVQENYIQDFITRLKECSGSKILDVEYLGSYPAPINLHDFELENVTI